MMSAIIIITRNKYNYIIQTNQAMIINDIPEILIYFLIFLSSSSKNSTIQMEKSNSSDDQSCAKKNRAFKRQNKINDDDEITKHDSKRDELEQLDERTPPRVVSVEFKPFYIENRNENGKESSHKDLRTEHDTLLHDAHNPERQKQGDASNNMNSVKKKCSKEKTAHNSERRTPTRKERSKSSTIERKRRSEKDEDESQDDQDGQRDRSLRKKRKTPTKKVMKLHNLTADLLFQVREFNMLSNLCKLYQN